MSNKRSTTRGMPQHPAPTPANAKNHEAHKHGATQSTSSDQESRSESRPGAGNTDLSSSDCQIMQKTKTTTNAQDSSTVLESKLGLQVVDPSSTDLSSFPAQPRTEPSKPTSTKSNTGSSTSNATPNRGNTYSSNSNAQNPLQASTRQEMSIVPVSKSGPEATNPSTADLSSSHARTLIQANKTALTKSNTNISGSNAQKLPKANTTITTKDIPIALESKSEPRATNILGTVSSSSNNHGPSQVDTTATSLPAPPRQESVLDTGEPSKVSSSSNRQGEQLRTQNQGPPPRDEGLYAKVELQEQILKTLADQVNKLYEKIHAKQENRWTFQWWPVMAAPHNYHSPASTTEAPESGNNTPVEEREPAGTANSDTDVEKLQLQKLFADLTAKHEVLESEKNRLRAAVSTMVPKAEADVEKLRLEKLVTDLTAKQEVLQSENNHLSATMSSMEQRSLDHGYLLASHNELNTIVKTHRCPTGDELECTNSELRLQFEDLQTRIEELIDHCDTSSIDLQRILRMSKLCLANAEPSWWGKVKDEEKKKLWLRGLLANVLHAEFFEKSFYFDLNGKERLEEGLTDFENLIFGENSGVEKRVALEWRARTFRLATELINRNKQSRNTRVREAFEKLKAIFEHSFDAKTDPDFNHLESLQEICEKALHCSSLLRSSTSTYIWDQRSAPISTSGHGVSVERIRTTHSSNGAPASPFNVFAEVLKLRRNNASEQILKPTVAVFCS